MHKKDVQDVDQVMFIVMGRMHFTSNAFIVCNATEHLYGKRSIIALHDVNIGLSYGSRRAVL
jgi:hypothetical protein